MRIDFATDELIIDRFSGRCADMEMQANLSSLLVGTDEIANCDITTSPREILTSALDEISSLSSMDVEDLLSSRKYKMPKDLASGFAHILWGLKGIERCTAEAAQELLEPFLAEIESKLAPAS